jgi:enolase-phosphatase E1
LIWKSGFESRELIAHLYDNVVPAMRSWFKLGIDLRIYSSGSVGAQKLFFGNTEYRDLTPLFTDHYDTKIGSKREAASYDRIVESFGLAAEQLLFVSDVVAELDAAKTTGLQTALSIRPGNAPVEEGHGHPVIHSFAEITVE